MENCDMNTVRKIHAFGVAKRFLKRCSRGLEILGKMERCAKIVRSTTFGDSWSVHDDNNHVRVFIMTTINPCSHHRTHGFKWTVWIRNGNWNEFQRTQRYCTCNDWVHVANDTTCNRTALYKSQPNKSRCQERLPLDMISHLMCAKHLSR